MQLVIFLLRFRAAQGFIHFKLGKELLTFFPLHRIVFSQVIYWFNIFQFPARKKQICIREDRINIIGDNSKMKLKPTFSINYIVITATVFFLAYLVLWCWTQCYCCRYRYNLALYRVVSIDLLLSAAEFLLVQALLTFSINSVITVTGFFLVFLLL